MNVADAIRSTRSELDDAARACGRDPGTVGLVAVSKTHPSSRIAEAISAGHLDFGESYAQELRDKAAELSGVRWHFIGRIQRNKVKYIAPVAWRVHGVTHLEQAEALGARAPQPLPILLNVNVGNEPSKDGVDPADALTLAEQVTRVAGVRLVGLMCIPPHTDDPEGAARWFAELAHLAETGRNRGLPLQELSMGMSHDWKVAVRYGATWVRVGTAIFGERSQP